MLFVDEAYRLYDPLGRTYMQEAIDEIVTLLTEEAYRGKMVVIFAGYSGQMSEMLEKVNPGLKSRVSDVIDFPDFSAAAAAELAAMQLEAKQLSLPAGAPEALEVWTTPLAAAPQWANGRDVETFVRRVAVECATRKTTEVTSEALDAALATVCGMKGPSAAAAAAPMAPSRSAPKSAFMPADPIFDYGPNFDILKAMKVATADGGSDDEDADDTAAAEDDFAAALEDAIVGLGYDADDGARRELASLLGRAVDGRQPFPEDIRSRVARKTGASAEAVDAALKRQAKAALTAVTAAIEYERERRELLEELDDEEKEEALNDEARILDRLRTMGPCPAGFAWHRSGNGWRCGGGSHFVYDDDPILKE